MDADTNKIKMREGGGIKKGKKKLKCPHSTLHPTRAVEQ